MKKIFAILLALGMLLSFAACGGSGPCGMCGKEGADNKRELMGEEGYICDDCLEEFDKMAEGLENLGDLGDLGELAE